MKSQKLPWFRMYCDFLEDPKILSLAFEDQRHFIGVLALKSSGVLDQSCSEKMMNRIVAQKLWISHDAVDDVKRRLCEAGLIDDDWQPMAWDKRQFVSDRDPSCAERQRRYREKTRNALRDASVTLPETETDTETNTEKHMSSGASPDCAPKSPKRRQGDYTPEFEQVWQQYPTRPGNSKADAYKAWNARLKAGATADQMQAGVQRYAAFCAAERTDPRYIKQAATFFGPGEHFLGDWTPTKRVSAMNEIGVDDDTPEGFGRGY